MRKLLQLLLIIFIVHPCLSQDSLRGSITAERAWWDVIKYDITVQTDIRSKSIDGINIITFKATADGKRMQIDLQEPMEINEVALNQKQIQYTRAKNVFYLDFEQ